MNNFFACHPFVAAVYFCSVLLVIMFAAHPVLIVLALLGGILFFIKADRRGRSWKETLLYVGLFGVVSLSNPLFSHNGVTPLFFLNGNPITLEAVVYGVYLGVMLIAVVYWFKCFNLVLTEDKLLFLCGRLSPKMALLLSSALRFIPLLKTQAEKIRETQSAMGLVASDTWSDKLRGTARVYSALITWALENAIDTGSAMKARGYGLKGRSHFALFRFRKSDAGLLALIVLLDAVVIAAMATNQLAFEFYPMITATPVTVMQTAGVTAFAGLSFLPFLLEVKESLQWTYYRSKI